MLEAGKFHQLFQKLLVMGEGGAEIVKWGFWRKLPPFYHFCGVPMQWMKISDFAIYSFTNDLLPSSLYNLVLMKGPNCVL